MQVLRIAAIPLALAVSLVEACKKDATGPSNSGTITCSASDATVCPPSNLSLGFTGSAGTPTITPTDARTSISTSSSAFSIGGSTSSTASGYWFLVVDGTMRAWGFISVNSGSYSAEIPLFCGQQGVVFRFDNATGRSYWYATVTLGSCTVPLFRAQLTWDTGPVGSDIDLHLVRPGGSTNTDNDCYYLNCQGFGLEWGAAGPAGNPLLDVDNTQGFGPENITLDSGPETGTYRVIVHNYNGVTSTHATVKLYFNDVEQSRYTSAALDWPANEYWTVATVNIGTKTITSVNTYSSTAPAAPGARPTAATRVK